MYKYLQKLLIKIFPEIYQLKSPEYDFTKLRSWESRVNKGVNVSISTVSFLQDLDIGDFSYINDNAVVSHAIIGKFCSIGPNFFCGWGYHPTNGISTSPVFYSETHFPTYCKQNKVEEHETITIGNDVFIGANVTVLEGVTIGDGAVIGAGTVVSKDIPPYAVAVGSPVRVIRYRFSDSQIDALLRIQWWNFKEEQLMEVEQLFFNIDTFIKKYDK
jgi:acetyltransferase-like isoleucine patch superfamily enzyme